MRWYLLPLFPLFIFCVSVVAAKFIDFASDNDHRWWGGFPLWMAGGVGILAPILLGGLFVIASFVWP